MKFARCDLVTGSELDILGAFRLGVKDKGASNYDDISLNSHADGWHMINLHI